MKQILFRTILLCAVASSTALGAKAQTRLRSESTNSNTGTAILRASERAAVIVVGSAAKMTWATTKFVAKDMAKPVFLSVAKPMVTKAAPKMAKFALKKSYKYLLPLAVKLSVL